MVILPDNDEPGRAHAREVAAALAGIAASVRIVELPGLPAKGDVSDWLAAGGTRAQLEALAAEPAPPAPATPAAAPAPPPVPLLQDLLDDVEAFLRAYVVFPSRAAAVATTLWVTHTYVIETVGQHVAAGCDERLQDVRHLLGQHVADLEDLDDEVVVAPRTGCRRATPDDRARLGLGDGKNLIDVAGLDGGDAVLAEDLAEKAAERRTAYLAAQRGTTPSVPSIATPK